MIPLIVPVADFLVLDALVIGGVAAMLSLAR